MPDSEIGYLTGSVKPGEFDLKLTDKQVGKGSFIKVKHQVYGWVLAKISTLKTYLDDFDEDETKAHAYTIGYRDGGEVLSPKTPFKPNERVYLADRKLISDVLNLGSKREDSIYLGFLEGHEIPVYLDVKKTIEKHMSVLAKTGAGKSYCVAVILEELLKSQIPVVILDPHGEYSSLAVENDDYDAMIRYDVQVRSYADQVVEYTTDATINPHARKLALKADFTMEELLDLIPINLTEKEKSVLYTALQDMESGYSLDELMERIEEEPTKYKWKVLDGLGDLARSTVFTGVPTPYSHLVQKGKCSIINLKGSPPAIAELVVARLTRGLFHMRTVGKIPELFFLVEEAHNFCPERGFGDVMSSPIMRTIAGEGRKFGFHLCVVSQRPARVDKNVLSQCTTQVILKVTNPNDLKAIRQSIEGFTQGMEEEIQQLPVGHALIVSEALKQPITVDIRCRQTKHGAKPLYDEQGRVEQPPKPAKARRLMEKKEKPQKRTGGSGIKRAVVGIFIEDGEVKERKSGFWSGLKDFFIEPDDGKGQDSHSG
jgi:uncharacterized protein